MHNALDQMATRYKFRGLIMALPTPANFGSRIGPNWKFSHPVSNCKSHNLLIQVLGS